MPFEAMQTPAQPLFKLATSNMELLMRFSTSPEITSQVTSQATANAGQWFQQAGLNSLKLMQTGAYTQLMQGMMKNYTEFITEVGQTGLSMLSESQAALMNGTQQAVDTAEEAVSGRARRSR